MSHVIFQQVCAETDFLFGTTSLGELIPAPQKCVLPPKQYAFRSHRI